MQDLNDLFYFVQVVEHEGFSTASRALGIPKSRLSRRVAALEEELGVRLIHRSTRTISVTELGKAYYEHCAAMLAHAEAAQAVIDRSIAEPRGMIRVACPPGLLCFVITDMLTQFMQRYPRVQVELDATGRRVDVIREGYDLAIRVRFPPFEDSELVVRTLSSSPQKMLVAPALLEEKAPIKEPKDLALLPSLDWVRPGTNHQWDLESSQGTVVSIPHQPRLVTDDLVVLRAAALAGLGVVQLPLLVAYEDIKEKRLVEVLPDWQLRGGVVQAVFPSRRGMVPAVRTFIDYLANSFAEEDWLLHKS